jgi:trigger factor
MEIEKLTLEDLTPVRKRLQVQISAAAVQAELDRAFAAVGRDARLRGFRPGKAPRSVLERFFGDQVRREVLGHLVEESFQHAVATQQLAVVGTPDIEAETLTAGAALRYSATVDVRPPIELGSIEGLAATRPPDAVPEAEVDKVLVQLRESAAQLRPIEGRSVIEPGDVVSVDLTSRIEGADPVRREGVFLEAGGGSFPQALERQLVGQHRGARLSLEVPYPADYGNPSLAGKTAAFDVVVQDLRSKHLPPLDDDFARDHGRCESLDELRRRIREDLERDAARRADAAVRAALLDQLLERHQFDVPSSLVDRRTDTMIATLDLRIPEGPEAETMVARLRDGLRPRAEREVRAELLLDALVAREGITVSDDDVGHEIAAITARAQEVPERVRSVYERPEARRALAARIARERVLEKVASHARIVPGVATEEVAREN